MEGWEAIGRQDACPYCRNDLHCCLNCRFYDEYAQNKCRESSTGYVRDREKNNFCEFFSMPEGTASGDKFRKQQEARAKLEELFKKKKC